MNEQPFSPGDTVYLLESMRFVRKCRVIRADGEFCVIRFEDSGGGIRTLTRRLYATQTAAEAALAAFKITLTPPKPTPAPPACNSGSTFLAIRDSCKF